MAASTVSGSGVGPRGRGRKRPDSAPRPAKSSLDRAPDVVRTAAQLFYERGYEATSVQDVADALGLLKGSLYYYIRTKEDLLYAVVEQAHRSMMGLLDEIRAEDSDTAIARISLFLRRHLEVLLAQREIYGVVLQDYSSLSPKRRKQATQTRNEYAGFLQSLIEDGQREGSVDAHLDARLTCLGLLGMMNWTYKWYRSNDPLSRDAVVQGLLELGLRSIEPADRD